MFRNRSDEGQLNGGQSSTSLNGHRVSSAGYDGQESSWIGLLAVVSRPALSFFQKYVTDRVRNPVQTSEKGTGWWGGGLKNNFVEEETGCLRQLDDMVPASRLTYLQCEHDAASGLLEPAADCALSWLTADSLREVGIQTPEAVSLNRTGHLSSVRTLFGQVLLSSPQEIKPTAGKTRTWWGSFWGGEEASQKGLLSDVAWAEEEMTGRLCPQQLVAETKAIETTDVFVQSSGLESILGENTGLSDHKDQLINNGGLHAVHNTAGSTQPHRLRICDHLSSSGAATTCSEVALLTPDQDNGYSSLEEEQLQMTYLYGLKASGGITDAGLQTEMGGKKGASDEGEKTEEEQGAVQEGQTVGATVLSTPECQNKAIAFIMGCPCSDEDSSQSDGDSSDDDDNDDDDGFDSEGSSELSSSSDEDDDEASDSDGEESSDAERLWSSLCQSQDPYNPRNFTALQQTLPRAIPTCPTPPSSTQSTPNSSPQLVASTSPPCTQDSWDDSTSASEVDEAESFRLWSSFSCNADPYSPFNFQAPLRTRGPSEAAPRVKTRAKKGTQTPSQSPHHKASSPEYRMGKAEERLNKSCSEEPSSSWTGRSCAQTKKVRFCDDVEEFFASCGEEEEDRRGPWEELARDRCRFLRRCQEVEQSIAYCLQPQHRSAVYRRLTILYVQDA